MTEWRKIEGHEGYEISVEGVRSYLNNRHGLLDTSKMLKPWKHNGYLRIKLDSGKQYLFHRLLAIAFIPNPENKPFIDHINRNKLDNCIENLRWVSHAENQQNVGVQKNNKLGIQHISHNGTGFVFSIKRNGVRHYKYFKTLEEAEQYKTEYLAKN